MHFRICENDITYIIQFSENYDYLKFWKRKKIVYNIYEKIIFLFSSFDKKK